jgi:exodeoxyribonuclease VII small subunit
MAKKNGSYKEATIELEKILKELESNELSIDDLENKVKQAAELIELCKEKLFKTDAEIEKILQKISEL